LAGAFKTFARELAGAHAGKDTADKPPVDKSGSLFGRLTGRR
jgi:hypothetical protein